MKDALIIVALIAAGTTLIVTGHEGWVVAAFVGFIVFCWVMS